MAANWSRWWRNFQGSELLPIIPPGATLKEGSTVRSEHRGKTPGVKNSDGTWSGLGGKWSQASFQLTENRARQAAKWGASIGIQSRVFIGFDIDIEDEGNAQWVEDILTRTLGPAPVRYRENSARRLLMYRIADGEMPLKKRRVQWLDSCPLGNTRIDAFERLGIGQQYVIEGEHPSGGQYLWRVWHPCDRGPDALTPITQAQADTVHAEICDYLDCYGYSPTAAGGDNVTAGKTRKPLTDVSLHAPSTTLVLSIMDAVICSEDNFQTRDAFVSFLAALKAAFGLQAEENWPAVLDWALNYPGAEESFIAKIWNSITDAELGWEWLAGWARGHGWREDAQADFEDEVPAEAIAETVVEKMQDRYAWCSQLERYVDLQTNLMLSAKAFNATNVQVAEFGKTGTNSAEAIFLNTPGSYKAALATYRPGAPTRCEEKTAKGKTVKAVNLWRPSDIVPAANVTEADVRPWLDHVELIFGPLDGSAARHFLGWCAFKLQCRGEKINHALVILGEVHGTGKDTVMVPIVRALGQHNVSIISPDTLTQQWTHYLISEVVIVEEMHNFERRATANKLKPMLAAPPHVVDINTKNVKQYSIPNIQCWVMFTNHPDAIPIEDSDRRYWVHHVQIEAPAPKEYFERLYGWYEAGGIEKVAGWLLARDWKSNRDRADFSPMAAPPMTKAKAVMIEQGLPKQTRWAFGLIGEETGEFYGRELLTVKELIRAAHAFDAPEGVIERHGLQALRRAGYKPLERRINMGAAHGVMTVWVKPDGPPPEMLTQLPHDKLVERYLLSQQQNKSAA